MRWILAALMAIGSAGCKHVAGGARVLADDGPSNPLGDIDELVQGRLLLVCGYLSTNDDERCHSPVLDAVCAQGKTSLSEALAELQQHPVALKIADGHEERKAELNAALAADFTKALASPVPGKAGGVFKRAIDYCINKEKADEAAAFAQKAATPEFQARAEKARESFWTSLALGVVYAAAIPAIEQAVSHGVTWLAAKKAAPKTALKMSTYFWLQAASAGADGLASFIHAKDVDWNADQCGAKEFFNSGTLKACLQTVSTLIQAFSGAVDVRSLGVTSDADAVNLFMDVVNVGLSTLCQVGGKASRIACGVINAASAQIVEAIKTGKNEWSTCVPTAQAGRCLGTLYGSGGWTNNSGITQPRRTKGTDGRPWWVRDCCECERVYYRSHAGNYYNDLDVASDTYTSVIQSGNFASGNCGVLEGHSRSEPGSRIDHVLIPYTPPQYESMAYDSMRYQHCMKVTVIGSSCSLTDATGKARSLPIWSESQAAPFGMSLSSFAQQAN